ncbi:MAG: PAS domain S-box protein [Candidatus Dadabacteria bacterium]|nr:PAS domain S-box protein [Candidatus Dadabacteria bacterium]
MSVEYKDQQIDYKSLYDALYENNISMHFTVDREFNVLAVNNHGAENLGYRVEDMIKQKFTNFIYPDDQHSIVEQLNFCLENPGQIFQWEFRIVRKDGEVIWVKDNARTIGENEPDKILISCEDITVKKQSEQSVDEMIASYKIESLGRLAGGIAHDFNNLLTGILGNLSLIKTKLQTSDPSYDKFIEIESSSIKAKELAEKLFVFSTGGRPYKSAISIYDALRESMDQIQKDCTVTFDVERADTADSVNADFQHIKQVFYNILLNAAQAMSGSGKIDVKLENIIVSSKDKLPLQDGEYIKIGIHDTGVGITPDDLPKVFDPYYSTKNNAAGLGLSIAQAIINNHSGHLDIESVPEVETTVHIYLPVFKDQLFQSPQPPPGKPAVEAKPMSGKRVLVMDDEEFIRKVAGNILEHLECKVDFAVEGAEAIEKYKASYNTDDAFDFLILDLTVPEGMGGEQALAELFKIDPNVKAFLSSGYTNDPVMVNYKDYGFVGIIKKPYEIEDFINTFCSALDSPEG